MLKKVVDIKTKSDWLLMFQLKKFSEEVENSQLYFPPSFCVLLSDIAQSYLNCACTQENHGRIFSLLEFLSWMKKGLNYICVNNLGRAIVKHEKHVKTVRRTWCRKREVFLENNSYIWCYKVSKESKNGNILFWIWAAAVLFISTSNDLNLLTRAIFPMDEKNLSIVFCGTQGGLRTTALRKSM